MAEVGVAARESYRAESGMLNLTPRYRLATSTATTVEPRSP